MIPFPHVVRAGTVANGVERVCQSAMDWLWSNRHMLIGLILTQVVAYGYLFSTVVLTNHTFPNTWIISYPSFKTYSEGRWLADIIISLQGGSGVQCVQMAGAACLQAVNALLFARLLGLVRRLDVVLAGLFLCLYPAFLDYYSFSIDHLTFCIGDTLVLVGATLLRFRRSLRSAAVASVLFALSLAAYQPKLSLMLLMLVIVELLRLADGDFRRSAERIGTLLRSLGTSLLIAVGAVVLYALSLKVTLRHGGGSRTNINDLSEFLVQALASHENIWRAMTADNSLAGSLRLLPVIAVALGTLGLVLAAWRRGPVAVLGVLVLVGAMPLALRATYLVNDMAWKNAGRIAFANGYAILFFLSVGLRSPQMRPVFVAMTALFVYTYFIVATQESNAAAMKTTYETQFIARIAAQVEPLLGADGEPRPVVVVGMYPEFPRHKYVRHKGGTAAMHEPAFAAYRQAEMLNVFLGREAFRKPTVAEVSEATDSVEGHATWPSPDAVYDDHGTVVILLEPFRNGVSVTRAKDR